MWLAGPAVGLFQKEFFAKVKLALKPGGITCLQGICILYIYLHYF